MYKVASPPLDQAVGKENQAEKNVRGWGMEEGRGDGKGKARGKKLKGRELKEKRRQQRKEGKGKSS